MQWLRRILNSLWLRLQQLLGIEAEVIKPSTPAVPPKVESITPRTGLGEPELGLATAEQPQYRKSQSLFTYPEREFYKVLIEEVGNEYQIFAKVRLGDFIYLANEPADRKYHINQIQCKHVDFLLCDKVSQQPLMVIELDDSSHGKYDRRESDEFKLRLFSAVGLQLLRVKVQRAYPKDEVGNQVRSKIREAQHAA